MKMILKRKVLWRIPVYALVMVFVLVFFGRYSFVELSSEEAIYDQNITAEDFIEFFEKVGFEESENGEKVLRRWEVDEIPIAIYYTGGDLSNDKIVNIFSMYASIIKKKIRLYGIDKDNTDYAKVVVTLSENIPKAYKDINKIYKKMGLDNKITFKNNDNCYRGNYSIDGKINKIIIFISTQDKYISYVCIGKAIQYIFGLDSYKELKYSSLQSDYYHKKVYGYALELFNYRLFEFSIVLSVKKNNPYYFLNPTPLDKLSLGLLYSEHVLPNMTVQEFRSNKVQQSVKNYFRKEKLNAYRK